MSRLEKFLVVTGALILSLSLLMLDSPDPVQARYYHRRSRKVVRRSGYVLQKFVYPVGNNGQRIVTKIYGNPRAVRRYLARRQKATNRTKRWLNHHLNSYCRQIDSQTLADLDWDRLRRNRGPLMSSPLLNRIAKQRARQIAVNFSHYDSHGRSMLTDDLLARHVSLVGQWAENIAYQSYGYHGKRVADHMNNDYMNHDAGSHWGHRRNILNRKLNQVGVGAYYDRKGTYQVEDFRN